MKKIESTIYDLCDEIDELKYQVEYWKTKYRELMDESVRESNERLEDAKRGVGQALLFALSIKDDENGNLVINKGDRKGLAEMYKTF